MQLNKLLVTLAFSILFGSEVFAYDKHALERVLPLAQAGEGYYQNAMGLKYQDGENVLKNDKTSVKWFRLSAGTGFPYGQTNLAFAYYYGDGVLPDMKRAYMWFNLGIYNGAKGFSDRRHEVGKLLNASQLNEAQEMSRRCLESNYTDC